MHEFFLIIQNLKTILFDFFLIEKDKRVSISIEIVAFPMNEPFLTLIGVKLP
jgi:hypothetical protein